MSLIELTIKLKIPRVCADRMKQTESETISRRNNQVLLTKDAVCIGLSEGQGVRPDAAAQLVPGAAFQSSAKPLSHNAPHLFK